MKLLSIDPGPTESAYVVYDGTTIYEHAKESNDSLRQKLLNRDFGIRLMVVEEIACYGMAVGTEVFTTCRWTGRFIECAYVPYELLPRMKVKMAICHNSRAKDGNIRQALIDHWGGRGAIGTKKAKGPLHGICGDEWQALALAVAWFDMKAESGDEIEINAASGK